MDHFIDASAITCLLSAGYARFKSLRYEEDYVSLKSDSSQSWYKNTKYKPLPGNAYISIGGDIRYQYFHFKNEDWGRSTRG